MSGKGTPATQALERAGVKFALRTYQHEPGRESYALEAVEQLGLPAGMVHKTLVVEVDGRPHVAVVPADATCDLKAMAIACGSKRAEMADPAKAMRITGYVLGGVSPFGQKRLLPTVLDSAALDLDTILVSGGRRGLDIELAPQDLVDVLRASTAAIARR